MAGSEGYNKINASRSARAATSRGNLTQRYNGSDTPF